jgi:hypothetical protein
LLVLTAYFDESGNDKEGWFFVAGFIGDDAAWRTTSEEWPKAIFPLPRLHMNKLHLCESKAHRKKELLERAGLVSKRCGLTPIVAGVRHSDYIDLIQGSKLERLFPSYLLCCVAAVIQALRFIPEGERLEIVYEQQTVHEERLTMAMGQLSDLHIPQLSLADGTHRLANWRFAPKRSTNLTEPSDYLAYALLQQWRDPGSWKAKLCRPILDAHNQEGLGRIMDRATIREVLDPDNLLYHLKQARKLRGERELE